MFPLFLMCSVMTCDLFLCRFYIPLHCSIRQPDGLLVKKVFEEIIKIFVKVLHELASNDNGVIIGHI